MLTRHIELSRVARAMPLAIRTLYVYRRRGSLPWLQRAPSGQGSKARLVVDWPQACAWFAPRGVDLQAAAAATLVPEVCRLIGIEANSTK